MENNIPPQRCFIHKGRFFFCDTGSMQTVRLTLWLDDWGPVLWYISTVLLYIGSPRSRPVWIQADLAHNSYQWSSVLNIFKGSTTSSKWWGYHARVPPISQVTTNLSWQTRPSQIPPWIRSHRSLRIILSIMDTHMISGVHLMSILMTNEADLLTNVLPSSENQNVFVQKRLHHIFQTNASAAYVTWGVD